MHGTFACPVAELSQLRLQKGGMDYYKDKGQSSKEVGPGFKAKKKLSEFFTQLAWEAESAGHDVLTMLEDACDFCTLLSGFVASLKLFAE